MGLQEGRVGEVDKSVSRQTRFSQDPETRIMDKKDKISGQTTKAEENYNDNNKNIT